MNRTLMLCGALTLLVACSDGDPAQAGGNYAQATADANFGADTTIGGDSHVSESDTNDSRWGKDCPGGPGCQCTNNDDCDTNLCITTADGKVCSKLCVDDCPKNYLCRQTAGTGGDLVFACVDKFARLCDPCSANKDCNEGKESSNVCIPRGDKGSFCGVGCGSDADCKTGYNCTEITDQKTGKKSKQCVPESDGECKCSKRATSLGLETTCKKTTAFGACSGQRSCTTDGLTKCIAKLAQKEICNGFDDDCDGSTDVLQESPDKAKKCSIKNNFGECHGKVLICEGGKDKCNAQTPTTEKCNGIDDNCDGITDEGLCNDGNPCTHDKCNSDGSCKHDQHSDKCDDGSVCTKTDVCTNGKCIGKDTIVCDDNEPCTKDTCDKNKGCQHPPASGSNCKPSDDDGNVCTDEVCKGGVCTHPHNKKLCDDGDKCTQLDKCYNGKCTGYQPKDCNDGNSCTNDYCDPKQGCKFSTTTSACSLNGCSGNCKNGKCVIKQGC